MEDKLQLADLEVDIFRVSHQDRSFLMKMLAHLKPEYFDSTLLSKMFKLYQDFYHKFNHLPTEEIVRNMMKKMGYSEDSLNPYMSNIFNSNAVEPAEKEYILDEVVKFGKRARMRDAIMKSVDLLEESNFEAITSEIREALMFNIDPNIGYDLYDVDERYAALHESLQNRMSTGYNQMNSVLGGGWAKKELYAVMGPPGMGKSIFLPNFGYKALVNGYNVVHYSMEMSEERVGLRYDAIASSISTKDLKDHPDEIKKKYDMVRKLTQTHLKIKEFPTSMASTFDIESHLEQLKLYENFVPDVVILDYGDIMKSTRKTSNLYEEQGWIFRELRGLAVKQNIVVLTATQTNRESLSADGQGTKEVVGMNNTADSMEKNRILDGLFSISQNRQDKDNGKINLWVAKNRNGEQNKYLEFLINYDNFQVKEMNMGSSMTKSTSSSQDDSDEEENLLDE